jgi:hypothetical protein
MLFFRVFLQLLVFIKGYILGFEKTIELPFEERQYCGKFAAILPNVCHLYERTIAGPVTMKKSMNGKHGKWNKTKKKHLASLSLWKNCGKQLML